MLYVLQPCIFFNLYFYLPSQSSWVIVCSARCVLRPFAETRLMHCPTKCFQSRVLNGEVLSSKRSISSEKNIFSAEVRWFLISHLTVELFPPFFVGVHMVRGKFYLQNWSLRMTELFWPELDGSSSHFNEDRSTASFAYPRNIRQQQLFQIGPPARHPLRNRTGLELLEDMYTRPNRIEEWNTSVDCFNSLEKYSIPQFGPV